MLAVAMSMGMELAGHRRVGDSCGLQRPVQLGLAAHSTAGLADAAYCHEATSVFGTASYHSFDWLFFASNLKENVAARIAAYEHFFLTEN